MHWRKGRADPASCPHPDPKRYPADPVEVGSKLKDLFRRHHNEQAESRLQHAYFGLAIGADVAPALKKSLVALIQKRKAEGCHLSEIDVKIPLPRLPSRNFDGKGETTTRCLVVSKGEGDSNDDIINVYFITAHISRAKYLYGERRDTTLWDDGAVLDAGLNAVAHLAGKPVSPGAQSICLHDFVPKALDDSDNDCVKIESHAGFRACAG